MSCHRFRPHWHWLRVREQHVPRPQVWQRAMGAYCVLSKQFNLRARRHDLMCVTRHHIERHCQNNSNNNATQQQYNLERLRFNRRGASTPLWGVESCSPQAGGPTQSQLSRPMSSGHHISMEHRLRRKQLNSDTNASNKTYMTEMQEKRKGETFFLRKKEKKDSKKKEKQMTFLDEKKKEIGFRAIRKRKRKRK